MLLQGWKENKWGLRDKLDLNAEDPHAAGSTPLHAAIFSTSALAHKNVRATLAHSTFLDCFFNYYYY